MATRVIFDGQFRTLKNKVRHEYNTVTEDMQGDQYLRELFKVSHQSQLTLDVKAYCGIHAQRQQHIDIFMTHTYDS